jgi:hypothetical protein
MQKLYLYVEKKTIELIFIGSSGKKWEAKTKFNQ